ncbi:MULTISPECIES: type IV toxin-antitoxin system AbiEi family antitoxin domain-containing protein [unclassified Bradyrhizobium]|uniref:type IV toxin-antitoxin system AbiEi family antitoxin domain-containing protein n=1 Tax=unclassified Bradyrhizobium TaxID=2631580 RepID=UPI001FF980BC|nr:MULTISPECIES: type IV toxin-antitoxin system AbiEi family antitoxin domain-containing protein [unclassified Bradyrhizobium]MCK1712930.1 type IV toxin-antitoxin system AbiEi family antitoxin [Bradyrhizobium sp. 143]MCK1725632.1 type IV toxin-antitoxin system AbiEi family antitoxin [Bradyrhizobium sp. 142]
MTKPSGGKLNCLEHTLPEGLLVDAGWMTKHGYSTGLRSQYVSAGWLVQPTRGTFKRPLGTLTWQKAVISLQTLLECPLIVGGRTALELQGFSHYLRASGPTVVYLYGPDAPPGWLFKLPLKEHFTFRKSTTLFKADPVTKVQELRLECPEQYRRTRRRIPGRPIQADMGQGEWPLTISSPERALLELLDELPHSESFHQVDMLVEGLRNLSPRKLQKLLDDCRSVKVKRLFFWFADRHDHSWLKQIDRDKVDLGKGKRMLAKGGRLDPKYLITVPEDLSAPI